MRVALDTNVLAYSEGLNGSVMKSVALELIDTLPHGAVVLPVQTLGELFQLLIRKAGRSPQDARSAILTWRDAFILAETSAAAVLAATDSVVTHHLNFWDAVILAVAAESGCHLLLSEDMQDGFVWRGVTIANPFARSRHPLLKALLAGP
jgi:predicted nucleic acid-binding protein